jgi:hypothetical protein
MTPGQRLTRSVLALGTVLALSGCGGQGGAAPPASTPAATDVVTTAPSVTATPTPSPSTAPGVTLDAHPALGDLVISTSGLGPLLVGSPPAGNPGAGMIAWVPGACPGSDPSGRWSASGYPDDLNYLAEPAAPFRLAADDSSVSRVDVMGSSPATATGVHIGSPLTDLQAAYPDLLGPYEGATSRVWWVQDAAGTLAFETQGDSGGLRPAGTPEGVILIRILEPGVDPAFATANSGDVADAC